MDRFHEMKVMLAVADEGGFAKAARRLNSSPPAMTRTIAGLEARLGVEIFTRTTRRVHLTETGRVLAERARVVLSDLEIAEREAAGEAALPTGQLTITASVTMGRSILPPIISAFLDGQPRVTARVMLLDRVVNLVEEGIDVGLRIGHLADSTMVSRGVGQVRRMLFASPAYLDRRGRPRSPAELKHHSIIAFSGLMPNREWIHVGDKGLSRISLQPRIEINDASAAIAAAEQGEGIAIALSYMVAQQVRERRLVPLLERYEPPPLPVNLVYPESRIVSSKIRAFIDFASPRLRTALKELPQKSAPKFRNRSS